LHFFPCQLRIRRALENPLACNTKLFALKLRPNFYTSRRPLTFFRQEKLPHGMVRILYR
jgi:hypothetical protein